MTYRNEDQRVSEFSLAHLGLVVADAKRSADFYTQILGCTVTGRVETDNLKIVYLQTGGQIIELLEYIPAPPIQRGAGFFDHIAFAVVDIAAAVELFKEQGIKFETDTPRLTSTGKKIIFFAGPDGERIELMEA